MSKLLLAFYGDDFTGSTDALEQLTLAGIRAALFIEPPTPAQLKRFPGLEAVGVAGFTRSLAARAMKRELSPAFKKLKALGARHIHYKICSTFDSSPKIGNLGCVLDVAAEIFHSTFVPLLVAAPVLGRYCIFGNLFARYGIGSNGGIYRLDRHPSVSKHPVTPMKEADLRLHLAKQTKKKVALFNILQIALPGKESQAALKKILVEKPDVILFDALYPEHLMRIGELVDTYASAKQALFSIGSSGIETALAALFNRRSRREVAPTSVSGVNQVIIASGSCSNVTADQISWALKHGFGEVALNTATLIHEQGRHREVQRAASATVKLLRAGKSVIVHTTRRGANQKISSRLKHDTARVLGTALGEILCSALKQTNVQRICVAGGDTSSFAARALGIKALEMIAPLTPGAPLCLAYAPGSPVNGREVVFKGGQVGAENYFGILKRGRIYS